MEHSNEEGDQDLDEMARIGDSSESSRLVNPPTNANLNILNIISNICCIVFTTYIFYLSFANGIVLFSFHPTCMTAGWLMLMTSAVNSISPGDVATDWLPVRNRTTRHWILQACGLTFTSIGFFAIIANKIIAGKDHFTSLHGCFGLTSYILAIVASCGGISALYSMKLKKYMPPVYMKLIHSSFGIVTFVIGMVAISLGLFSKWYKGSELVRYIGIVLLFIITVFTILRPGVKLYARIRERITYVRASN